MRDISMMTPSEIAFKYDGNKRQIATAVQRGILDPTAAALAGIFIDRMLQSNLEAPKTTVYQDMYGGGQGTERGVAALPVSEDMVPDEYAGGGIVAFANRGEVSLSDMVRSQQASDPYYDQDEDSEDADVEKLKRLVGGVRGLRETAPTAMREEARKFYQGAGERASRLSEQQMALAGLGAAGALLSTRGGVGKALAEAEKASRPGLQKALETKGGAEEARIKGLLGIEEKERAELGEDIKGAENILARKISAGPRSNQLKDYVRLETDAAIEQGDNRPRKVIEAQFARKYMEYAAAPRAEQAGAATLRSKTDVDQAIAHERKDMQQTINIANTPIRDSMPQATKDYINRAKAEVAAMEARHAEMRRSARISSPPAGGGGGTSGWGELRVR